MHATLAILFMLATTLHSQAFVAPTLEPPKTYACHPTRHPPTIDGKLDDPAWLLAPWTTDFVDIEGPAKPLPRLRTRVKILYDSTNLYIAAELEEPDVKATLTQHDSIIFHDNDFELFLKPPLADPGYFEFEINALDTGWDLFLNKPYREHGHADNSWAIPGLQSAVSVQGTLNQSTDTDRGWTVELAIPWKAFTTRLPTTGPTPGSDWRINFSRVEWTPGKPMEDNWVWSPQGVVNMHVPDRWGHLYLLLD
ncbi:carbohydrate-binding family 9-like protein [Granulicella arctica]|uniref:carbohydrate-binding family 9-like protein n=1 Tax=Granulicella arctica TaxID=940613 RepID=UPI0021E052D1|nr:carbohydrate-binding family 9-like protein [Granulicella arctica]